jgi:hypothetical protein
MNTVSGGFVGEILAGAVSIVGGRGAVWAPSGAPAALTLRPASASAAAAACGAACRRLEDRRRGGRGRRARSRRRTRQRLDLRQRIIDFDLNE